MKALKAAKASDHQPPVRRSELFIQPLLGPSLPAQFPAEAYSVSLRMGGQLARTALGNDKVRPALRQGWVEQERVFAHFFKDQNVLAAEAIGVASQERFKL